MIVEVRSYRIEPGRRAEFIRFFETRAVPALRAHGIQVTGPLIDLENPNKFVWLRSFPSLEERDRMGTAFYDHSPPPSRWLRRGSAPIRDTSTAAGEEFLNDPCGPGSTQRPGSGRRSPATRWR